jgi:Site-specific recombinases, DNA invertase Pin homologs
MGKKKELTTSPELFVSYGYLSAEEVNAGKQNLESQQEIIIQYLESLINCDVRLLAEYEDIESEDNNDRPDLFCALYHCKMTGSTLIVDNLERLPHSMAFISRIMEEIGLVACNVLPATTLSLHVHAAILHSRNNRLEADNLLTDQLDSSPKNVSRVFTKMSCERHVSEASSNRKEVITSQ